MKLHSVLPPIGLLLLLTGGCQGEAPPPVARPTVRTDAAPLREMIALPDGFGPPRWVVQPLGTPSFAPGPTDYLLVVYLPLLESGPPAALGPAGAPHTVPLDDVLLRALLPGSWWEHLPLENGKRRLTGLTYAAAPFEGMPWHATLALELREQGRPVGLLLWLQTM